MNSIHPCGRKPACANRLLFGFTLIELLTVIAIIGILASIMIPVVGRVRSSARHATCISNLRQAHIGIMAYVTDNKGWFPDANVHQDGRWFQWWRAVAPYLNYSDPPNDFPVHKVLQCPEVARIGDKMMTREDRMRLPNYGFNSQLGRSSTSAGSTEFLRSRRQIGEVRTPSRVILAGDHGMAANDSTIVTSPGAVLTPESAGWQGDKHNGGSCFVWVDGHVSTWKNVSLLNQAPWMPNGTDDVWTP